MVARFGFLTLVLLCITVQAEDGYFLHVTDFHWDFTYGAQDWSCNDIVTNHGMYGDYWCDSPWTLINATVQAMKNITNEKPADFIFWTGDNVLHVGNDKVDLDIHDEILRNLTDILRSYFPVVPVYATYGNHDYYPHNQFPPHNNELYNRTLEIWKSWINDVNQEDNFRKGGYYTVKTTSGLRILALNTNLYYTSDKVTAGLQDPADQFSWMEKVLNTSRQNNEKVIVTAHVPPGIAPPSGTRWMYKEFNQKLISLFVKYSDVITGMHFGHEHADNFRVLYKNDEAVASMFMAPSVTPWRYKIPSEVGIAHNPGFRVIKYDKNSGKHLDIFQYYMDLPESNRMQKPMWKLQYTATTDMAIPDMTPKSMDKFAKTMTKLENLPFQKFHKWRFVSADHPSVTACDRNCHSHIYCNLLHSAKSDYDACVNRLTSRAAQFAGHWIFSMFAFILTIWFL